MREDVRCNDEEPSQPFLGPAAAVQFYTEWQWLQGQGRVDLALRSDTSCASILLLHFSMQLELPPQCLHCCAQGTHSEVQLWEMGIRVMLAGWGWGLTCGTPAKKLAITVPSCLWVLLGRPGQAQWDGYHASWG